MQKFKNAIGHWANGFYNKSGIKALYSHAAHKKLCGYEVKIMHDNHRLFTGDSYQNDDGKILLIFNEVINHGSHIVEEMNIHNVKTIGELELGDEY